MKRLPFIILFAALFSCSEDLGEPESLGANAAIIGTWVEDGNMENVTVMARRRSLDPERYGFIIKEDGTFIEHKNAGFCGTPPITYDTYEGEWVALSDSLLEITVGYWGGTLNYQIRIVSFERDTLKIRYLYAENRADSR
jgi:hypothetical protein